MKKTLNSVMFLGPIRCVDVSRDGMTVATGGDDNQVILWKIAV
jgi:WD40 repeat protein